MSYVDENLAPGESVVYRTTLHKSVYLVWFGVMAAVVLIELIGLLAGRGLDLLLGSGGAGLFLCGMAALVGFMAVRSSEYVVTNQRVVIETGWLRRRTMDMLVSKVESVTTDQSYLGRQFDWGQIVIGGSGGSKQVFLHVKSPSEFRRQAQNVIIAAQRRAGVEQAHPPDGVRSEQQGSGAVHR